MVGSFVLQHLMVFFKSGIVHQKTNPHTLEHNGLCERLNRMVVERVRCFLFDANLENSFWAEAVNSIVYVRNRTLASGLDKTPYELWTGRKPDHSHIRIFGSTVMIHVPKTKRTKWDRKAEIYILLGYTENTKGYRSYNLKMKSITTSRHVVIIENNTNSDMPQKVHKNGMVEEKENVQDVILNSNSSETIMDDRPADDTHVPDDTMNSFNSDEFCESMSNDEISNDGNSSSVKRERRTPVRYGYSNVCLTNNMDLCEDSLSNEEVLSGGERDGRRNI